MIILVVKIRKLRLYKVKIHPSCISDNSPCVFSTTVSWKWYINFVPGSSNLALSQVGRIMPLSSNRKNLTPGPHLDFRTTEPSKSHKSRSLGRFPPLPSVFSVTLSQFSSLMSLLPNTKLEPLVWKVIMVHKWILVRTETCSCSTFQSFYLPISLLWNN